MDKKKDNSFPFVPDMDCDGDHDFYDFLIFQDQINSLDKKEKEDQDSESKKTIKDYSWRENTEDGSDYDIFPEDYETEEEYLEALEDARYYDDEYYDDDDEVISEDEHIEDEIAVTTEPIICQSNNSAIIFDSNDEETQEKMQAYYESLKKQLKEEPNSITVRSKLVDLLYNRAFSTLFCILVRATGKPNVKYQELLNSKERCKNELLELLPYYKTCKYVDDTQRNRLQFTTLLIEAEISLCTGDFVRALASYKSILTLPFIKASITEMINRNHFTNSFSHNDLKIVMRVIHNIAVVYQMLDLDYKARALYKDFNSLVKICYNYCNYMIERLPKLADEMSSLRDVLCGFEDSNTLYVVTTYNTTIFEEPALDMYVKYIEELEFEVQWKKTENGCYMFIMEKFEDEDYALFYEDEVDIEKQIRKIEALY